MFKVGDIVAPAKHAILISQYLRGVVTYVAPPELNGMTWIHLRWNGDRNEYGYSSIALVLVPNGLDRMVHLCATK